MTSAIGMSEGMNDVKRFDCLDWRYSDDGSCVDYTDYEALQQERDALQQQLAAAREALQAAEALIPWWRTQYETLDGEYAFMRCAADLERALATLQRDRQP